MNPPGIEQTELTLTNVILVLLLLCLHSLPELIDASYGSGMEIMQLMQTTEIGHYIVCEYYLTRT